jgi:hypothetical protein
MLTDIFGDQKRLTVNLTVKMLLGERTSKWDNDLQMQLMVEWSRGLSRTIEVYRHLSMAGRQNVLFVPTMAPEAWLPA